jgi:hypothetical protein
MEIRPGSGWFGVPAMIAAFAFLAFAANGYLLAALVAIPILFILIGAVIWYGKRRGES